MIRRVVRACARGVSAAVDTYHERESREVSALRERVAEVERELIRERHRSALGHQLRRDAEAGQCLRVALYDESLDAVELRVASLAGAVNPRLSTRKLHEIEADIVVRRGRIRKDRHGITDVIGSLDWNVVESWLEAQGVKPAITRL